MYKICTKKLFLKEIYVCSKFYCVHSSHELCAHAQLRGNIAFFHFTMTPSATKKTTCFNDVCSGGTVAPLRKFLEFAFLLLNARLEVDLLLSRQWNVVLITRCHSQFLAVAVVNPLPQLSTTHRLKTRQDTNMQIRNLELSLSVQLRSRSMLSVIFGHACMSINSAVALVSK